VHIHSKQIIWTLLAATLSLSTPALAATVTLNVPKSPPGRCFAYGFCSSQGVLTVARSPEGIYGFVTRSDKKCVALLFDEKLYARARPMNRAIVSIDGIGLPRLAVAEGVTSTSYFDRTMVEGNCGSEPLVIYVTAIRMTPK
jgi:hypothetical protein